jgi:hypothetical protein
MKEIHNYSFNPVIKFKQSECSFSYKIIKESIYPNKESLAYILSPNKYHISDGYFIKSNCTLFV